MKRLALLALLLPSAALAHPGGHFAPGLAEGLIHPLTGADHLLAMLGVGLWAAVSGGRALWALPLGFVAALLAGGLAGAAGLGFPAVEPMIAVSVLLLGIATALRLHLPLPLALAGVAAFGLVHGLAHGAEAPLTGLAPYAMGFVAASLALHGAGLLLGRLVSLTALRLIGTGTVAAGLALALA